MNNSSATDLLQRMNDQKAILLIPAFVYMGVLMFTGFIGNAVVCYFYKRKTKSSPTTCFIVILGVFDLISCTVSIPMEIVDIRFFYMFPDATACKVLRTTTFVCTISSGIILVAIATERYRKICLPFKKQITVLQAKFIGVISTLMAFVFSWPSFVFYSIVEVDVPIPGSGVIQGYDCTTVKDESLRIYLFAFNAFHFLLFVISTMAIIVLYVLIYKQLIRVKKIREKCTSLSGKSSQHKNSHQIYDHSSELSTPSITVMQCNNSEMENYIPKEITSVQTKDEKMRKETIFVKEMCTHLGQDKPFYNDESKMLVEFQKQSDIASHQEKDIGSLELSGSGETMGQTVIKFCNNSISLTKALNRPRFVSPLTQKMSTDINTDKYTIIMLLITVIFIVSFLPYLCLSAWQSFSKDYLVNHMSDLQLVFFSIGIRSYFLNSVLNPFIYGFFNLKFREFIVSVFCVCFRAKRKCERTSETRTT